MRRISAQDQQAFGALYDTYGKAIYSLAYRILQEPSLAEEVTQDTLLKVWQRRATWDPNKGSLKNWLLAITHFTAVDRLRAERRQPTLYPDSIEEVEDRLPAANGDSAWQDGIALRIILAQLPDEQASLIELAFFRGMSHSQIADATRIPLGTIKTRLRTALHRLRELWSESVNQTSIQQ
ncbi:MAG TPA: sigma-70 family RNA polymerase sigma factor [Aggregatilineales bacterium]|nr:sigma-70 family RNA polymerase sigma factor [Aggregatilineales bacterium]